MGRLPQSQKKVEVSDDVSFGQNPRPGDGSTPFPRDLDRGGAQSQYTRMISAKLVKNLAKDIPPYERDAVEIPTVSNSCAESHCA